MTSSTRARRFIRIHSKHLQSPFPPSPPMSPKTEKSSRQGVLNRPISPSENLAEQSDVPCYTCRRRHVKCDKQLPTCAKCAKKGVPCLGYQKPLRWADGVAVRGKLKGKSRPVVDTNVCNIVHETIQEASNSAIEEAAHFGLHTTPNVLTDAASNDATLLKLLRYHNTEMCSELITFAESRFIHREIAQIPSDFVHRLPRDIVNCILGVAAVHMANRQPGNREIERLALETKVNVFQSFNKLLHSPENQQPDVIICCGILIYAMDVIEYGLSRWMVHFLGSAQVMHNFGGIENLFSWYPHLQLPLTHVAHFETMWIILSHVPITKAKQASRSAVEMLCRASLVKRKFFNPCPTSMTLAIWDIGACASGLLSHRGTTRPFDMLQREKILQDVLAFRPETGVKDVQEFYYQNIPITENRIKNWDLICTAWKGAITILTLRYLFFGRANLVPQSTLSRARTPPLATQASSWFTDRSESGSYFQQSDDFDLSEFLDEGDEADHDLPEHLSAGLFLHSRAPSPGLPASPAPPSLWANRYEIHNEAFSALSMSFFTLHQTLEPACLRHVLMPLIILALVSRPNSPERTLCLSLFQKAKEYMAVHFPRANSPLDASSKKKATGSPSPQGGDQLDFDIPWEKLDAYSMKQEQDPTRWTSLAEGQLTAGAPEWNWWDMLNHLELDLVWPCTSGTSHFERGSDFWAFKLVSSVVNDECFSNWTGGAAATGSQASSSST